MAGVLSRFSPPQLKNSSNNENTAKSTCFWLLVWKKWCLKKGIAKEIENYVVKPRKRRFHFIESDSDTD